MDWPVEDEEEVIFSTVVDAFSTSLFVVVLRESDVLNRSHLAWKDARRADVFILRLSSKVLLLPEEASSSKISLRQGTWCHEYNFLLDSCRRRVDSKCIENLWHFNDGCDVVVENAVHG